MPAPAITGDPAAARILVVDHDAADVQRLEELLGSWGYGEVRALTDSAGVVDAVADWRPDLLLLALQMASPDGGQVLEALRPGNQGPVRLPILVLTADTSIETRRRALSVGASDFVAKPFDADEVRLRVEHLLETRRLQQELARQNQALEQRVRARTRDLERTRLEILHRLGVAAEYRDDDTRQHAQRVGRSAALMADVLGLGEEQVQLLRRVAPLHDIGKLAIPDAILLKPGKLTALEFQTMKGHTIAGSRILGTGSSRLLQVASQIARTHHERWDGRGYPAGLTGEDIPVAGRLVSVADVFDALTHDRPYKSAVPVDESVAEVRSLSGVAFDPQVVDAFEVLDHEALLAPVAALEDAGEDAGDPGL